MRSILALAVVAILIVPSSAAAQAPGAVSHSALIGLARVKRDAGDFTAAADAFRRAERLAPLDPTAREEMFWVLAEAAPTDARVMATRLLEENPRLDRVRDRAILLAVKAGDEAAAMALASSGASVSPSAVWLRRTGESLLRQRDAKGAARWFQQAAAAANATPEDHVLLAVALEGSGDTAASLQEWQSVSTEVWANNQEWRRSYLRVSALAGDAAAALAPLEAWVAEHADDETMRVLLTDVLGRTGQKRRALEVIAAAPAASRDLLVREVSMAIDTGDLQRAVRAQTSLTRSPESTLADQITLGSVLLQAGRSDDAFAVAQNVAKRTSGCNDGALGLFARIQTPAGLTALRGALARFPVSCAAYQSWVRRVTAELMSRGQFAAALETMQPIAMSAGATREDRESLGKLLLWTGQPESAIAVLEPMLREGASQAAGEALVDAYRTSHRSADAWRIVTTAGSTWQISADRRLDLANLAIERGAAARAIELIDSAVSQQASLAAAARPLRARALIAAGQPQSALPLLEQIPRGQLDEAAMMALIDATQAVRGRVAAGRVLESLLTPETTATELLARGALWTAPSDEAAIARLRARLRHLDERRDDLLEVELALRDGRPQEATALTSALDLDTLGDSRMERIADLRSIALEAAGRHADADILTGRLQALRRDDIALLLRREIARWRATPQRDATQLLTLAAHSQRTDVQIALASALLELNDHAQAIRLLSAVAAPAFRPIAWRTVYARALEASGDPRRALSVMPALDDLDVDVALVRAGLIHKIEGIAAAESAYTALAARADATPEVYQAWGRSAVARRIRVERLAAGHERFPAAAALTVELARVRLETGETALAMNLAREVIDAVPNRLDAWELVVDATRLMPAGDPNRALIDRLPDMFATEPQTIVRLAERLGTNAAASEDVERAVKWARATKSEDASLAEARILQNARQWTRTLDVLQPLVAGSSPSHEALRLRAQTLAWSGRHREAMAAYEKYLKAEPGDLEAGREQARLSGWAQQYDRANRLYTSLVARYPHAAAVAAEARAKRLVYAARWDDAAPALREWLRLEPQSEEALFDLAETLSASRDLSNAKGAYSALANREHPNLAAASAQRALERGGRLSAAGYATRTAADGYGGQRLLQRSASGANVTLPVFGTPDQWLRVGAGSMVLEDRHARYSGHVGRAEVLAMAGSRVRVEGQASIARAGSTISTWDAGIDVTTRATDRVRLGVGLSRAILWENLTSVSAGVAPWGPRAMVNYASPDTVIELRGSRAQTGDNTRVVAGASLSQRVVRGRSEVRVQTGAERTAWARTDPRYFSPRDFLRVDAGPEWRYAIRAPQFRGDRSDFFSVGYLAGTDQAGTFYHQPRARLSFHLGPVALDADGSWVRSAVYQSSDVQLTVRIGG